MDKMYKLIKVGLQAGFVPNVHAIGTKGVAEMLDLYERLKSEAATVKIAKRQEMYGRICLLLF